MRDTLRRSIVQIAAVFVVTAAQLLRQAGAHSWDTIWAEDGPVYASDALDAGFSAALRGYAGYVQLVPRLLALPLRILPADWWARWLAGSSALVTSVLALYIFHAAAGHLEPVALRALLALASALSPAMWFEVNANVANLGWPLLFAAFWAIIDRRRTPAAIVVRTTVLVAAALTTTLALLYVPLMFAVTWRRRWDRRELVVVSGALVAMTVQVIADHFTAPGASGASSVGDIARLYVIRVVGSATVGERGLQQAWTWWTDWSIVVLGAALLAGVIFAARQSEPRRRLVALLAGASLVFFVVAVWVRGADVMRLGASDLNEKGSRYVVVPALFLTAAVLVTVQGAGRRGVQTVAGAQLVLIVVTSLWMTNLRSGGPGWRSELDTARETCSSAPSDRVVEVKTTPDEAIWVLRTTCGRLR